MVPKKESGVGVCVGVGVVKKSIRIAINHVTKNCLSRPDSLIDLRRPLTPVFLLEISYHLFHSENPGATYTHPRPQHAHVTILINQRAISYQLSDFGFQPPASSFQYSRIAYRD